MHMAAVDVKGLSSRVNEMTVSIC